MKCEGQTLQSIFRMLKFKFTTVQSEKRLNKCTLFGRVVRRKPLKTMKEYLNKTQGARRDRQTARVQSLVDRELPKYSVSTADLRRL